MESLRVVADKNISAGEELTFNYGNNWWKNRK
jgi:SET domain-containing protein